MIYKSLHRQLKIEQHEIHSKPGMLQNSKQLLLHMWHLSCYSCYTTCYNIWMLISSYIYLSYYCNKMNVSISCRLYISIRRVNTNRLSITKYFRVNGNQLFSKIKHIMKQNLGRQSSWFERVIISFPTIDGCH